MSPPLVLIYQENKEILPKIREIAVQSGWSPYLCESVQEMRHCLVKKPIQVLIIDMLDTNIELQILFEQHEQHPRLSTIVLAEKPTVREGIGVMKLGAIDYLSYDGLESNLSTLLDDLQSRLIIQKQFTDSSLKTFQESTGLIGSSQIFKHVLMKAVTAAREKETILITGESGTGKELLANAIHQYSYQAEGTFIPVNCGAIPESLIESELFGHMKGAYTSADSTQMGFFQSAQNGTLFLDEIGNTSLTMQAKLLRVMEEKEVWKVGARRPDQLNVRIIAAANIPLQDLVEKQTFRQDLYYRLKVLSLHIPPLRERYEDILPLCYFFVKQWALERKRTPPVFSDAVLVRLQNYDWPGNIRELKHLVTELLIYSRGEEITQEMLPANLRLFPRNKEENPISLEAIEKDHIHTVCTRTNWNVTRAATVLGLTRQALYRKLHRHHLGTY